MNTLVFFGGCGVGVFVCGVGFIWSIAWAHRTLKIKNAAESARSLELLAERNQIQKGIAKDFKTIAQWCEQNWKH